MADRNKLPRALELHTRAFYDALVELGKPDPEMGDMLIVETRLSYLHQELDIPGTYYAKIRAILFGGIDPCAVMLRRGTHGMPSIVALRHPPDAENFTAEGLTPRPHAATLLEDATERVRKLEAWRDSLSPAEENRLNVVEAIRNHETRLVRIEAQILAILQRETNGKTAQDQQDRSK
jgi:hypothetical protein